MTQGKVKILVVDDTEATRYTIARTLRAKGYETIEAGTGAEALRLSLAETPDLVTLDIHLPDALGFDICRQMKADPATAHIPVLQVSASYLTTIDRVHGLEGGADAYLTHPVEAAVLLATVKALLRARQLDEDLRRSEERFRVALMNAPIMIYTCDLDLRYTWIYNQPEPFTPRDFVGKTDAAIFDADDAEKLTAMKRLVLRTGAVQREMMALTLGGTLRYFDLTVEPFLATSGEITGLTVAGIDVTERKTAELSQVRAMEEAELANQAKSRFLSNMSHEIRTPLGVIQGFADLALDPTVDESDRQEYLRTIKRNSENLTMLLGEILDLSKIEAGRIEIEKTRFCLPALVNDVILAVSLQARERGIALSFQMPTVFPDTVDSDPTRIRQILINLISNAVKFTLRGGVQLTATVLPKQAGRSGTQLEFRVTDTGIGISTEQSLRLFQAFSQADSSTTRKFGGTGLGLSLSQKLARALGGDVSLAESAMGVGSVFVFSFDAGEATFVPAPPAPVAAATAHEPMRAHVLEGLRVLLVEDSLDNQMLISRYLKYAGAGVDVASDGEQGIALALASAYDVILMDVQMPNVDGAEATTTLRAKGLTTPIVALTAHALKEERERALALGFTEYLTKPFSPALLFSTVLRLARAPGV